MIVSYHLGPFLVELASFKNNFLPDIEIFSRNIEMVDMSAHGFFKTSIVHLVKFIRILGGCFLLLLIRLGRRHGLGG